MNYQNRLLLSTLYILIPLLGFAQTSGNRIYVASTSSAGVAADGKKWESAYPNLQQALSKAKQGDSIWVAQGTYRPTISTDRTISFSIPAGVKLFGGFRGVEQHIKDRDWSLHPTIFSGRIGGVAQNEGVSSFHVFTLMNVDSITIDGATIEGGLANVQSPNAAIPSSIGGGIFIMNAQQQAATIIIRNIVFRHNFAINGGGIAVVENALKISTSLQIENCTFEENSAQSGGAIYSAIFNASSKLVVHKSHFIFNRAQVFAAVMYHTFSGQVEFTYCTSKQNECQGASILRMESTNDPITIRNCEFNNEALNGGGVIDILALGNPSTGSKVPHPINIYKNQFLNINSNEGGAVFVGVNGSDAYVKLHIEDCRVAKNGSSLGANGIHITKNTALSKVDCTINRCIFEENRINGKLFGIVNFINFLGKGNPIKGSISNCLFYKNAGPVIYVNQYSDGEIQLQIVNSTFFDNLQGNILRNARAASSQISVHLENSIFYNQQNALDSILQNTRGANLQGFSFNHSLFSTSSCKTSSDTLGCGVGNIFGQYPKFIDSSSVTGLKLAPGSIAINAGRWHPDLPVLDLSGQARVQDCKVDLGAYESPSVLSTADSLSAKAQIRSTPSNQALGQISIQQIKGGFPPYHLLWENGDTVRTRSNLAAGPYTLTLSDQQGCFKNYSFVVPFTTGLKDEVVQNQMKVVPNPVVLGEDVKLLYQDFETGTWQMQLRDLTGKTLQQKSVHLSVRGELLLHTITLPKGIYLLTLTKGNNLFSHKLVVQ